MNVLPHQKIQPFSRSWNLSALRLRLAPTLEVTDMFYGCWDCDKVFMDESERADEQAYIRHRQRGHSVFMFGE